jgi:GT2 family glycosyltransferase/Flp pilus assembly protein TadD
MKTVLALVDHPNLDLIIVPVLLELRKRGVQTKVLVTHAGRTELLKQKNISFQTEIDIEREFFLLEGQKLFLNAADQTFPAHAIGRKFDELCRTHGIPSLTLEHASFAMSAKITESYLFSADKMALFGTADYEEFRKLGVPSEKLVLTGFPPFDEYFEFIRGNTFVKSKCIYFAGQNHTFITGPGFYKPGEWAGCLRSIYRTLLSNFPDLHIRVKPHPAEPYHKTVGIYSDAIEPEFKSRIQVVDSKYSNIQGISNSSFVVTFSSSVLLEALLLRKRAFMISISKNLSRGLADAQKLGIKILQTSLSDVLTDIADKFEDSIKDVKESICNECIIPEDFLENYIYKLDGKSSERIADAVLKMMEDNKKMALQDTTEVNRPIFGEIGFERYQRLMGIAEEAIIEGQTTYTLLDIGSHDNAFKKFVPGADYFSYNGFISKAQKTFYKDSSFDVVVAADVLEHVKPEDRKAFLLELIRLAKKKVVFSFPSERAADFEKFVLTIIPGHKWLQEHVENGLPDRCEIENIFNEIGVPYQAKPNHSLASWVYSVIFDHSNFDQKLKQRLNEFFQKRCFEMENNEPAYRYIYTVAIPQTLDRKRILQDQAISTGEREFPLVSIIIPVFNKVGYTQKCLETLLRNTRRGLYEVIIIDNASTDGTKNLLERLASEFKIIVNNKNIGFAGACNQGARAASTEYLLFLNNDTESKSGWLEPLLEILDHDETVAAAGSKLLFPDNTIQHAGVVIFNDKKLPDPLVAQHIYYKKQSDLPEASQKRTYQALTAACLLIRKSAFYQVGGFDEGYWNGYEDVDLCFKFQEKGWKLVYQPESVLIHHESKSGPERFSKVNSNIERLHKRWLGKINPDCIIEKDGSFTQNKVGHIKPYSLPGASESTKPISSNIQKNVVSIIILTFNQIKYTKECVESIRNHTPELHEIIFVDNGSTDGTVKWLRKLLKGNLNYKLIENHKNLGFPKGCNQGIQASSGEYILLLNNDVVVTNGWLSGMLECLNSASDIGIVGPMTNNISGIQKVPEVPYNSVEYLAEFAKSFKERNMHRRIPVRRIVGFCMLFRRELVEKIGLLDETFGTGNFEDDDFCLRAALEGYKNFIAGDIFIHHYGSMSFRGNRIDYSSAMTGNRKIFNEKWSGIERKSSLGVKVLVLSALEDADLRNQKGNVDMAVDALLEEVRHAPTAKRLYYALSEILIDEKQFKNAYEILKEMSFDESDLRRLELIGYCAEGIECYDEADGYADRALSLNPASAPALNLKGILAHKKGDNEKAQELFQKAINADPGFGEPYTNIGVLKWASGHREEALNLLEKGCILFPTVGDIATSYHSAISALACFERAERVFREAQDLYPLNRRIAFLLIDTLIKQGKNDIAMTEIEKAMVTFGIDDGMLSAALNIRETLGPRKIDGQCSRSTLSLCMIVKNEEAYIAQCLMSVSPVIDEIIIVDTGSTDRTKDIAQVFGAQVYDFQWTHNFAEARNFSLLKAHGDWILVLDADEVISSRDHTALTELIKKQKPVGYSFTTRNYTRNINIVDWVANDGKYHTEEAADGWFPSQKVRLFPGDPRIRFENHVHEFVESSIQRAGIGIQKCKIPVHHYGRLNQERDAAKEDAYYELGKVKLQEKGDDLQALSELAVTAGTIGKYEEAIGLWQRIIALKPDSVTAFVNLGHLYLQLRRYEDALAVTKRAVELASDKKEAVLNYATSEVHAGDVKKAISVLEDLLKEIPEYPPAIGVLAAACCVGGEKEKGFAYVEKLKKLGFNCPEFLYQHARSLISAGRTHYAILLLEAAVESKHVNDDITLLLSELQSGKSCENLVRESKNQKGIPLLS